MVRRSHKWGVYGGDGTIGIDPVTYDPPYDPAFIPEGETVEIVPCEVKAGHVVFHHCRTWHGAPANHSEHPRPAIAVHYMPGHTRYEPQAGASHLVEHHIHVAPGQPLTGEHFPTVMERGEDGVTARKNPSRLVPRHPPRPPGLPVRSGEGGAGKVIAEWFLSGRTFPGQSRRRAKKTRCPPPSLQPSRSGGWRASGEPGGSKKVFPPHFPKRLPMTTTLRPVSLRCEYHTDPLGIDVPDPRLFWTLDAPARRGARQTAYQIQADDGALWDTGKVQSSQSTHVPYAGPALTSGQRVTWRVRVWDEDDQQSDVERRGVLADGPAVPARLVGAVDRLLRRAAAPGLDPSPLPAARVRRGQARRAGDAVGHGAGRLHPVAQWEAGRRRPLRAGLDRLRQAHRVSDL